MRAHQIMTRSVISVTPDTSIVEAANIMLKRHVSGLTVIDDAGKLVGVVSEGDFIRRSEIGTGRKRGRWLRFILGLMAGEPKGHSDPSAGPIRTERRQMGAVRWVAEMRVRRRIGGGTCKSAM